MFLHHANLLVGEKDALLSSLFSFLQTEHGIRSAQNPNFTELHVESLGIAESRVLIERQSSTGFGGGKKIFIISAPSLTGEAQNALLKVFEEPTPSTHFFLIVPSEELLLPTLRSRLQKFSLEGGPVQKKEENTAAKQFLNAGPKERLMLVEKLVDKKRSKKEDVPHFLTSLEYILSKHYKGLALENKVSCKEKFIPIWRAKKLLLAPGIGAKLILEELALALPNN